MLEGLTVIIQARCSSRRLPGKVLREVAGKPMIGYLIDRVRQSRSIGRLVVATSDEESDDRLASWCDATGISCFRGPLDDVAARFLAAARHWDLPAFVRLNADSPLLDPAIIDRAVSVFREDACDLATNTLVRSFPKGQSVEVISTDSLRQAHPRMSDEEREHVTVHFYRNAGDYRIRNFSFTEDRSTLQLSVDTEEDFARFQTLVAAMDRPHWEYGLEELLTMLPSAGRS